MNNKCASLLCAVALAGVSLSSVAGEKTELKTDQEKDGYSIGYDIGRSLRRQLGDVDTEAMARGLKDAMAGMPAALSDQEMHQRFLALRQGAAARIADKNQKDGEAFLAKNKGEKGVKTTASGLQYKVITAGKGPKPGPGDTVTVNYRGTLVDGTEFDSSYKRGQPATFPLNGVIAGWTEGLQLMKEGSKCMLYVPAKLAYGERGAGALIGPNSTLIFEVELLSIKKSAP